MSGPLSWKIMKKMNPDTAGTTIIGSRKNTVIRPRPRKLRTSSIASANPRMNSTVTHTTVISTVRHIARQNSLERSASQ